MKYIQNTLFLGLVGCSILGCQQKEYFMPEPKKLSPDVQFIYDMKAKTGGDINKLTQAEKTKMDRITHGMTQIALRANYDKHK